jgi:hypothetical protein
MNRAREPRARADPPIPADRVVISRCSDIRKAWYARQLAMIDDGETEELVEAKTFERHTFRKLADHLAAKRA